LRKSCDEESSKGHVIRRRDDERSCNDRVIGKWGDEKGFSDHIVRRSDRKKVGDFLFVPDCPSILR
jgi:hypothetical protein